MPARFLNDQDIDTLRKSNIKMNDIKPILGERYESISDIIEKQPKQKITLSIITDILQNMLVEVYDGLMAILQQKPITNEQLLSMSIFFVILALFQVYLSLA